jgi:hypothetical protein
VTTDNTDPTDRVPGGYACPLCDQDQMDHLEWQDDDILLCLDCGRLFDPERPNEQLGDLGRLWEANLAVVLDRSKPAAIRLAALHRIDRLFDGPLTPAEDLEAAAAELEANL